MGETPAPDVLEVLPSPEQLAAQRARQQKGKNRAAPEPKPDPDAAAGSWQFTDNDFVRLYGLTEQQLARMKRDAASSSRGVSRQAALIEAFEQHKQQQEAAALQLEQERAAAAAAAADAGLLELDGVDEDQREAAAAAADEDEDIVIEDSQAESESASEDQQGSDADFVPNQQQQQQQQQPRQQRQRQQLDRQLAAAAPAAAAPRRWVGCGKHIVMQMFPASVSSVLDEPLMIELVGCCKWCPASVFCKYQFGQMAVLMQYALYLVSSSVLHKKSCPQVVLLGGLTLQCIQAHSSTQQHITCIPIDSCVALRLCCWAACTNWGEELHLAQLHYIHALIKTSHVIWQL
jgi:hypothetical protein